MPLIQWNEELRIFLNWVQSLREFNYIASNTTGVIHQLMKNGNNIYELEDRFYHEINTRYYWKDFMQYFINIVWTNCQQL